MVYEVSKKAMKISGLSRKKGEQVEGKDKVKFWVLGCRSPLDLQVKVSVIWIGT